jgi:hypothetical protein
MTYTYDENVLSDLHKDARGFRPRGEDFWGRWAACDDDGKEAIWNGLLEELDRTMAYEAEEKAKAVADYEKEISEVIALGAGTRKRALLWMLDSEEGVPKTEFEIENWMWNRGLLSDEKIKKELIRTVKPIWKATDWINA